MSRKRLRISDVAKLAGVSSATISRVMSNRPGVSDEKRQEIVRLLQELDYHPSVAARSLAGRKSSTLGFVIPRDTTYVFSNPYYLDLFRGVMEEADKRAYRLLVSVTTREQSYTELFKTNSIDGLILTSAQYPDRGVMQLIAEGLPFALIGRLDTDMLPDGNSYIVDIDHVKAAGEATAYLISLGHSQIGYITGPMDYYLTQQRLRGYRMMLQKHGLEPDDAYVAVRQGFMQQDGYAATVQLLDTEKRPTAIVAFNDLMAAGAIQAVKERGLNVPSDVSVIGFDDIITAPFLDPPLTTVRHFPYKKAALATKLLVDELAGLPGSVRNVETPFELVPRGSCAPPRR